MFGPLSALFLMGFGLALTLAAPRPNIVCILADDLGWGDLSCYGGKVPTPNLDRLAREGTRFTQAYAAAPICSPARAALITGQLPARWRLTSYLQTRKGNRACEQNDYLDPAAPSLPRALRNSGYATAHVGKWHLGGGRDVTNAPPFSAYGYDRGFGTYESPEPHPDITATNWIWSAHDPVKRWERTRWMVDRTLEFLREDKSRPRFVNLWLDDPHTPWVPAAGRRGETEANLSDVLVELDQQIGRLLDGIREQGNTLVLFLSDNGPLPAFAQSRTAGLRGSKLSLYEGGIRVPLIAWWPGTVPAGKVNDQTVLSTLDVFQILTRLVGARAGVSDGEDLTAALLGKTPKRSKPLFWEYGRNSVSFAFPKPPEHRSPNLAMREGRWKLLVNADGAGAELYDLERDPKETMNLAAKDHKRVQRMSQATLAWRKSMP